MRLVMDVSLTSQRTGDITFFFEPKSVAVVGATNNPLKFGHYLLLNLIDLGFEGKVYPVNLKADEVLGLRAYPRVDLIPDEVEVVAVIVPAPSVPQVIRDCAKKGVKGVVILSSGFREVGGEGIKLNEKSLKLQRRLELESSAPTPQVSLILLTVSQRPSCLFQS